MRMGLYARLFAIAVITTGLFLHAPSSSYADTPYTIIRTTSDVTAQPIVLTKITKKNASKQSLLDMSSPEQVFDRDSLLAYASYVLHEDSNIQSITIGEDSIGIAYSSTIDVPSFGEREIERTATVTAAGELSITKPWYVPETHEKEGLPFTLSVDQGVPGHMSAQSAAALLPQVLQGLESGAI